MRFIPLVCSSLSPFQEKMNLKLPEPSSSLHFTRESLRKSQAEQTEHCLMLVMMYVESCLWKSLGLWWYVSPVFIL